MLQAGCTIHTCWCAGGLQAADLQRCVYTVTVCTVVCNVIVLLQCSG